MSLRILMLGTPKSGKTGCLASLADVGWKIRYLDFDDNPDPLTNFAKKESRGNIEIVKCLDSYALSTAGGGSAPLDTSIRMRGAGGWPAMEKALRAWPTDNTKPEDWDPRKNLLVFDSLTWMTQSKVDMHMFSGRRDGENKSRSDYGVVQHQMSRLIQILKVSVRCPTIVIGHLQTIGPDFMVDDRVKDKDLFQEVVRRKLDQMDRIPWRMGPVTIGKAQVDDYASLFSGVVLVEQRQSGNRVISLVPTANTFGINFGLPIPGLSRDYPVETGMATIMEKWLALQDG